MAKATNNIKSVCDKAEKLPKKYGSDLQFIYQKKRKALENNWREWDLQDIISWICGLDLSGKFKKYKKNLQKLSELESEEDHHDDKKSIIIDGNDIEQQQRSDE